MLVGEHLCGFQPFLRHRTLHNDVAMKLRQMPALLDHARRVTAYGFRADRPVYYRANLKKLVFERIPFFRNQCGIRGNTIENACAGGVADLFDVCIIKEEFHGSSPIRYFYCSKNERGLKLKRRRSSAFVSKFINGGDRVIHTWSISRVKESAGRVQAFCNRPEGSVGALAAKNPVSGQIFFRIIVPGEKRSRVGRNDIESGGNLRRSLVFSNNRNRRRLGAWNRTALNIP